MGQLYFRFPNFKRKALTFSYDDGPVQDCRLIELFNHYGLKSTFNLNSGTVALAHNSHEREIADVYRGHEVAVHTVTHPHLESLSKTEMLQEILENRRDLEARTGTLVDGMAYPFGLRDTNGEPEIAAMCGISYARTVAATRQFDLPRDFMRWHPTCHHADEKVWELTEAFLKPDFAQGDWRDTPKLFYLWGHSFEFDSMQERNSWEHIERLCAALSGRQDVWYATNGEIRRYVEAFYRLQKSCDGKLVYNPAGIAVYVCADGKEAVLEPGECTSL